MRKTSRIQTKVHNKAHNLLFYFSHENSIGYFSNLLTLGGLLLIITKELNLFICFILRLLLIDSVVVYKIQFFFSIISSFL